MTSHCTCTARWKSGRAAHRSHSHWAGHWYTTFLLGSVRLSLSHTHSRRPITAKARVLYQSSPYGIYGGRHDTAGDLSPSTAVFPCQYPSTMLPKVCSDQFYGNRGYISVFSIWTLLIFSLRNNILLTIIAELLSAVMCLFRVTVRISN